LAKFLANFKPITKQTTVDDNAYICGISFYLNPTYDIDISGFMPDMNNINENDLIVIAEKYAQLLLSINKGLLKDNLFEILKSREDSTSNTQEQLFINNVITFYKLLEDELNKLQLNNKAPLIRPISVFSVK
jgi:hypothetical protein